MSDRSPEDRLTELEAAVEAYDVQMRSDVNLLAFLLGRLLAQMEAKGLLSTAETAAVLMDGDTHVRENTAGPNFAMLECIAKAVGGAHDPDR